MLSYSGFARIASRVAGSGAWVRTSSSHDCLVSSIAAHSSPRGRAPASVNSSVGTCVSTLPKRSSPRALARRLAGSTVMTRTLPPSWAAAWAAAAAAVVVLPTPPEPQQITISFAARSDGRDDRVASAGRTLRAAAIAVPSVPQLGAERLGDLVGGAHPVAALEQLGHVQQLGPGRQAGPQARQVLGPGAAEGHGQLGPVEDRLDRPTHGGGEGPGVLGAAQRPEHLLLPAGE